MAPLKEVRAWVRRRDLMNTRGLGAFSGLRGQIASREGMLTRVWLPEAFSGANEIPKEACIHIGV